MPSPKKFYFITNEVSNSRPHNKFKKSIFNWAEKTGGELMVIRSLYKLSDQPSRTEDTDYRFDPDFDPFVVDKQVQIGDMLIMGDVNILQTASKPLSGLGAFGKGLNCIFGHPRQHIQTLPSLGESKRQFTMSTGSCCNNRFKQGKLGKKAQFNIGLGGIIVEVTRNGTFFRMVHADKTTGHFTDLGYTFTEDSVYKEDVESIIFGDTHCPFHDEHLYKSMFERLLPSLVGDQTARKNCELIMHDINDHFVRNHHNKSTPILTAAIADQSVESELNKVAEFLKHDRLAEYKRVYLVDSNHDRALDRWVNENDWRTDPVNAELMLYLAHTKLTRSTIINGEPKSPHALEIWLTDKNRGKLGKNVKFIKNGLKRKGWELSYHGDKGINGSRGSINSYSKIPTKTIIGHSHSTGIIDGCIQVGHTRTPAAYAQGGASSWSQSIAALYKTGKCQLLIFNDRKCTDWSTFTLYESLANQKKPTKRKAAS